VVAGCLGQLVYPLLDGLTIDIFEQMEATFLDDTCQLGTHVVDVFR